MKTVKISTSELIPIEVSVDRKKVLEKIPELDFLKVKAVPYKGKYLLRDGTHTSCAAELKNQDVTAEVYETDEEFMKGEQEFEWRNSSIEDFICCYELEILPLCNRQRIYSIRDLCDLYMTY